MASSSSAYHGAVGIYDERAKAEALSSMDLVAIVRGYLLGVVSSTPGYKALVLDSDTLRCAGSIMGRVEMGEHGVVLVERIHEVGVKRHEELKVRQGPCAWCLHDHVPPH